MVTSFCSHMKQQILHLSKPKLPYQYDKWNCHLILNVDINILNCGYRQITLSISTIDIIAFMYYWYRQLELLLSVMYVHCRYPQFQLLISLMRNLNNINCWYQQIIVDIHNSNFRYWQFKLSILTIGIIAFMYYWYRQLELSISIMYVHCWYRQLWTIPIVDINNLRMQQF